jgi:anti-sigma factor ChrR (cupin superfamily)
MELRSDFSKRYVVLPDEEQWRPSPIVGVERKMLDRIGDEVARATSIVKYAANAKFSSHVHAGGEEILERGHVSESRIGIPKSVDI